MTDQTNQSNKSKVALCVMAHPDDCEIMCAGTLALLHKSGWEINIATMTPGDCGSKTLNKEKISRIRKVEAQNSAKILNGKYYCLEAEDLFIQFDKPTLLKTISLIRLVKPTIVFTHGPSDYMVDHEHTSKLVRTACFGAGMPNIYTESIKPFDPVPNLFYSDVIEGKDILGNLIEPKVIVDISDVMDIKEQMLSTHASQRDWLREHHGIDEYIISMKEFSKNRGDLIDRKYAEGFRMHLGHGYPHNNILKQELLDKVFEK